MLIYDISNLPANDAITRKAVVTKFAFDDVANIMNLELEIRHYIGTTYLKDMFKLIPVMVDNNNPVIPDSTGDFDVIYEQLVDMPIVAILGMAIDILDSLGIINAKCNYQSE